jgi:hypothetical protein
MRICTVEPVYSRLFNILLFAALLWIGKGAKLQCRRQRHLPITSPGCYQWPHPLGTLQWHVVACGSTPTEVTGFCCCLRPIPRLHAGEHYDGAIIRYVASLHLTIMSLSLMESYGLLFVCLCVYEWGKNPRYFWMDGGIAFLKIINYLYSQA